MPVHDWTRVSPSVFHDFHGRWITHLSESLNGGLLPRGYYAMSEQPAEEAWPDVLTLAAPGPHLAAEDASSREPGGAIAVAQRPPKVRLTVTSEAELTAKRQRTLVIRHTSGDRIVALLEIVSLGNKDRKSSLGRFVEKALSALRQGYHLLIVDLFPPGQHDPKGIHEAIWSEVDGIEAADYELPPDCPLTLAAYEAKPAPTAYVESVRVGSVLPDMPLFIERGWYVNAPLEATYLRAWRGVPERWRGVMKEQTPRSG
jgi:hypothetical protein